MSDTEEVAARVAIGIAFGNSYSSIANTTGEGKAEVIANEEGGGCCVLLKELERN